MNLEELAIFLEPFINESAALRAENARLREALATFSEYQLATLEGLPAKTSKREHQRQQQIADKMVDACKLFGFIPSPPSCGRGGTPRLNELLKQQPLLETKASETARAALEVKP
jgi:hypothetical protein